MVPVISPNPVSGPTEEKLGYWPYRIVRTAEDLLAFGEWMQGLGAEVDKTPVGIAVQRGSGLALATKAQGWFFNYADAPPAAYEGLLRKTLLTERTSPALIVRDTPQVVEDLEEWLGKGYSRSDLLPNIIHDMTMLEYATGRPVARGLNPLKDALDCATVGPGMVLEAPRFYREVGVPLVRFNARSLNLGINRADEQAAGRRWTLQYDWLLFRVLTHYTRDPTLTRWFQDSSNPMSMWMQVVELEPNEAIAFLLWMVCGEDEELISQHYPDWATHLPEAPQLVKASRIDKNLPAFRLSLIRLMEQYSIIRKTETLYGRRSPWGLRPAELLHFAIMGSVNDLLDVVMASVINMGSETHWLQSTETSKYNQWLRATIVGYTAEEPMEWARNLEQVGGLNQPLGTVLLEPRVAVD